MTQPSTTGLQFTRKQRDLILAANEARLAMVDVMKMITAQSSEPDVNSKATPNPRLKYGRAIGRCSRINPKG